jgi:3-methyladenine DNA glycosylase/8-oxoguanine DNA glycosylase
MLSKLIERNVMLPSLVLEQLSFARRIADYADSLGVDRSPVTLREASDHLGAVLADAILQAGLSYRTVVRMRIDRIHSQFPEAATLPGLLTLLEQHGAAEFLLWNHPIKMSRFISLTQFLALQNIGTTVELKLWLNRNDARELLLSLHGIGPKTYDYLCCLVGIDCVAVDRHVRTFANEAGVLISDYERLRSVVSYAADLLGMPRRDFDAWIWQTVSARNSKDRQLSLI